MRCEYIIYHYIPLYLYEMWGISLFALLSPCKRKIHSCNRLFIHSNDLLHWCTEWGYVSHDRSISIFNRLLESESRLWVVFESWHMIFFWTSSTFTAVRNLPSTRTSIFWHVSEVFGRVLVLVTCVMMVSLNEIILGFSSWWDSQGISSNELPFICCIQYRCNTSITRYRVQTMYSVTMCSYIYIYIIPIDFQ